MSTMIRITNDTAEILEPEGWRARGRWIAEFGLLLLAAAVMWGVWVEVPR